MKRLALILLPVVGLVGCGTLPAPSAEAALQPDTANDGIDYAKMGRIDRIARDRGIYLVWISPPRLKVVASGG